MREVPKFPGEVPLIGGIYRHYEGGMYLCTGTGYDPRRHSWTVSYQQIEGEVRRETFDFIYRLGLTFTCDAHAWSEVKEPAVEEDEEHVRRFMLVHESIEEWERYNCEVWARNHWPAPELGAFGTSLREMAPSFERDQMIKLHTERCEKDQVIRLVILYGLKPVIKERAHYLTRRS